MTRVQPGSFLRLVITSRPDHLKKRPIIALPKVPASPPVLNILVVKLDA